MLDIRARLIPFFCRSFACALLTYSPTSLAQNKKSPQRYSIINHTISPSVGISQSRSYKVFSNTAPFSGATPELPNGIANISGLLKVFPSTISPPIDFKNNTSLFIRENMPIGQVVGQFSSTSKIPVDGFSLTQGKGDIHNSLFTIDSNGTLQSAAIFDYEASVHEFSIRVRATRGNESHIERIFSIQLVNQIEDLDADGVEDHEDLDADGDGFSNDEEVAYGSDPYNAKSIIDQPKEAEKESFRPIVRTLSDFTLIDGNLTVNAKIIDLGITTEKVIRGFIISSRPNAKLGGKNQQISKSKGNLGSFSDSFMVNQLTVKKVYIRAYARNSKGASYGTSIPVRLEKPLPTLAWADASRRPDADDWWESPWLGAIYAPQENGWILHQDLHWVFILPQPQGKGIWLWKEGIGWLWTRKSAFPYLFSHASQSWVFLHGSSQDGALLFDHQNENWLVLKKD